MGCNDPVVARSSRNRAEPVLIGETTANLRAFRLLRHGKPPALRDQDFRHCWQPVTACEARTTDTARLRNHPAGVATGGRGTG